MAILYKTFHRFRIALMVVFACFFGIQAAQAQNALFTIEDVKVDVTAENALKARELAFEQAQSLAFEELVTRMLPEGQGAAFENTPVSTISMLVKDYEVSDEKLSSKRYTGTYKFRFQDRAIKQFFAKSGTQYTDVRSQPMLVLPFLETAQGTTLWNQNPWMEAWAANSSLLKGIVPLLVPLGDLDDVSSIGDDEALTYNRTDLQALVNRYGASEAVIAIAKPEGTALSIQLYRTDRVRPEYVHQILERALPGQSQSQIYQRAVISVKSALAQDWKTKTVVDAREKNTTQARVAFTSLQEWSNIQRSLQRVSGISDVALKALSPREAYITMTHEGSVERLQIALNQRGLYLGTPRITPTSTAPMNKDYSQGLLGGYTQPEKIYELSTQPGTSSNVSPSQSPAVQRSNSSGYQQPAAQPYQNEF